MQFDNPQSFLRMLDALRDPVRLEIVLVLGRRGRTNVGDIAAQFKQSRPAISHHLKILKDAGLVESEKLGQEIHYWVERERIAAGLRALADLIETCCLPKPGLLQIEDPV